jgi:hypothetical protein
MKVGDLVRSFNEDAWHFGMHGIVVAVEATISRCGAGMAYVCWGEQGTFWERAEVIEVVSAI